MKKIFLLFLLSLPLFSLSSHENIQNIKWELTKINNIYTKIDKKPFIIFKQQTLKVKGFSGCNNFFGSFSSKEDDLTFSALASTRMLCKEESMRVESKFLKTLSLVHSYKINNKRLYLYDKTNKEIIRFNQVKP